MRTSTLTMLGVALALLSACTVVVSASGVGIGVPGTGDSAAARRVSEQASVGGGPQATSGTQDAQHRLLGQQNVPHLCTQMPLPDQMRQEALWTAFRENSANEETYRIHAWGLSDPDQAGFRPWMALPRSAMWQPGRRLRARFMGGTLIVRAKVRAIAQQWDQFSSVTIQFVEDGPAEIRVSFVPDGRSWSYIGTDCLAVPADRATMNFGWLTDTTNDEEYSRVVLHEFGHALGCVHEHQSPAAGIPWDKSRVYEYYRRSFGWSQQQVDQNVFQLYDKALTQFSAFDPKSIMLYAIPAELTTNGYSVGWNRVLSDTDKQFLEEVYPKGVVVAFSLGGPATAPASETAETRAPVVMLPPELPVFQDAGTTAIPPAPLPVPSAAATPERAPEFSAQRMGKLENYIRNNASVRKAEQLRNDPRFGSLSQTMRGDFLDEYGNLMFSKAVASRDSLIERTHSLDQDQMEMEDRWFILREKLADYAVSAAAYEARVKEHNAGIAAYSADAADYERRCLGGPLEPEPYANCLAAYQALSSRGAALDRKKAELDAELDALKKTSAELSAEQKKIADWPALIQPQWDFELKLIADWVALVDRFNARLETALGQVMPQ